MDSLSGCILEQFIFIEQYELLNCIALSHCSVSATNMLAPNTGHMASLCLAISVLSAFVYCIVLIALSRCNRVFTRRLRLCHSHTVYRREVREGDREGPNRLESEV